MSAGSHWFIFIFVSVLQVCNRSNDSCLNLYPCVITFGQSLSQSATTKEINGKTPTTTYQRNRRRMLRRYDLQRNDVQAKSRSMPWWCQWRYEWTCWQRNGKYQLRDCLGSVLSCVFHIFFFGSWDYYWRELPQASFLSRQTRVCGDKTQFSRQKYACHNKGFAATKLFVATRMIPVAVLANGMRLCADT